MARDVSPIVKQSRREGYALHPKAHKIMARKSGIPGVHAHGRQGKPSLYLTQLREKQKVRRTYGLLEKQFAKLMNEATRQPGLSGENLLRMLEQRMDNAVYRAGFATSRRAARQLVGHGHFLLNGRRVDIPSIRLKAGDELVVRPKSQKSGYFTELDEFVYVCDLCILLACLDIRKHIIESDYPDRFILFNLSFRERPVSEDVMYQSKIHLAIFFSIYYRS